jgi:hypothetical protein
MRLEITRVEGLRNDLLLQLERPEIESTLLSVAHRETLMRLPGIPRHRAATPAEAQGIADSKVLIDEHLGRLGLLEAGAVQRRAVAISNRNLGTNHGHLAWQRAERPRIFRVLDDPCDHPSYSCLTEWRDGRLSIEDIRFDLAGDRIRLAADERDVSDEVEWATFGQQVLRNGNIARIDEIADRFYDIRHVFAFDQHRPEGEALRRSIYEGYPAAFRTNVRRAWSELGAPRARYVHSAIGMSAGAVIVIQREGTVEEIGTMLAAAGAEDGIILDNGGSVVCWAWWANLYAGGIVSPTVDYRPHGTSAIAFVLKGPTNVHLPGGSVSYSVI